MRIISLVWIMFLVCVCVPECSTLAVPIQTIDIFESGELIFCSNRPSDSGKRPCMVGTGVAPTARNRQFESGYNHQSLIFAIFNLSSFVQKGKSKEEFAANMQIKKFTLIESASTYQSNTCFIYVTTFIATTRIKQNVHLMKSRFLRHGCFLNVVVVQFSDWPDAYDQWDQIGRFFNVFGSRFSYKSSPNIW